MKTVNSFLLAVLLAGSVVAKEADAKPAVVATAAAKVDVKPANWLPTLSPVQTTAAVTVGGAAVGAAVYAYAQSKVKSLQAKLAAATRGSEESKGLQQAIAKWSTIAKVGAVVGIGAVIGGVGVAGYQTNGFGAFDPASKPGETVVTDASKPGEKVVTDASAVTTTGSADASKPGEKVATELKADASAAATAAKGASAAVQEGEAKEEEKTPEAVQGDSVE